MLFSLFLIVSCQKEQDVLPQSEKINQKVLPHLEGVELVENRLVFESEAAFQSIQRLLREKGVNEVAIIKNQFPDFISMEDAYNNISESERERIGETGDLTGYENLLRLERGEDGEVSAEVNTGVFESQLLVNPHGIIQIGDDFRKIDYVNTYTLSKKQYNLFVKEGKVKEFLSKKANNIIVLDETGVDNANGRASTKCSGGTGRRKRVRGVVQFASRQVFVITKHQKRAGWIWWRNQAKDLSFSGVGSWTTNNNLAPTGWSGGQSCENCNRVSEAMFNHQGGSISNIRFSVTHRGRSDRSGSCSTRR